MEPVIPVMVGNIPVVLTDCHDELRLNLDIDKVGLRKWLLAGTNIC